MRAALDGVAEQQYGGPLVSPHDVEQRPDGPAGLGGVLLADALGRRIDRVDDHDIEFAERRRSACRCRRARADRAQRDADRFPAGARPRCLYSRRSPKTRCPRSIRHCPDGHRAPRRRTRGTGTYHRGGRAHLRRAPAHDRRRRQRVADLRQRGDRGPAPAQAHAGAVVRALPGALLATDTAGRYAAYETGLRAGFFTVDEVRRNENLPRLLERVPSLQ